MECMQNTRSRDGSTKSLFFPTTFMFWVSFSPAPDCVDPDCWNHPFSTPPRGPRNAVVVWFGLVGFSYPKLQFLSKVFLLKTDFHYTTIF